jgi:hypothetical protein
MRWHYLGALKPQQVAGLVGEQSEAGQPRARRDHQLGRQSGHSIKPGNLSPVSNDATN